MTELKPCPFCGGAVTMVLNGAEHSYFVYHKGFEPCLINEPFEIPMNAVVKNIIDAERVWNRRADNG